MVSVFKRVPLQSLFELIMCGRPTHAQMTYKNVMKAIEEQHKERPELNLELLIAHAKTIEFVLEWFKGKDRNGAGSIPYAQHVLAMAAIAAEHGLSKEIIGACLLKNVAQRHKSTNGLMSKHYALHIHTYVHTDVISILEHLATIPDFVTGIAMNEDERRETWDKRQTRKFLYLNSLGATAKMVELLSKIENSLSDKRDLEENGQEHWKTFAAKPQREITYYERCYGVFSKTLEEYFPSSAPELFFVFTETLNALMVLNQGQIASDTVNA